MCGFKAVLQRITKLHGGIRKLKRRKGRSEDKKLRKMKVGRDWQTLSSVCRTYLCEDCGNWGGKRVAKEANLV
jgi:hypothetical protein